MAEYIEREAVLKYQRPLVFQGAGGKYTSRIVSVSAIKAIPAADVAPVVHGRWEKRNPINGGSIIICSACGYPFRRLEPKNYCPNCGAKMDVKGGEG